MMENGDPDADAEYRACRHLMPSEFAVLVAVDLIQTCSLQFMRKSYRHCTTSLCSNCSLHIADLPFTIFILQLLQ